MPSSWFGEALTISKLLPLTSCVYRSRYAGLFVVCWLVTACADSNDGDSSSTSYAGAAAEAEPALASAWCQARSVLTQKCQRCHGETPEHGAPFSLVTYEDTQLVNAKGTPRYERIATAVSSDFMPPSFLELTPSVEPLTELERAALLDWCDGGAPGPMAADPPCDMP
jgi:uncharacterized membrane protein